MNKPKLEARCWECGEAMKITRKELAQVGIYPQCPKHKAEFRAWLTNTAYQQN